MGKNRYRYPSKIHQLYHTLRKKLHSKEFYNSFKRFRVQQKHQTHSLCNELNWVDPNEIKVMQMENEWMSLNLRSHYDRVALHAPDKGRFNPTIYAGACIGGDWDKYVKEHRFDRVYRGLKEHIENDVPLEETEYGWTYILRGKTYQTEDYTKDEIETTETLYRQIKEEGFKTRYELNQLEEKDPPYLRKDQWGITVNIDRDGNYIFNNTAHNRLAISKLLDLDEIPVTVIVKHKKAD